jgi:hypothetical protein
MCQGTHKILRSLGLGSVMSFPVRDCIVAKRFFGGHPAQPLAARNPARL